MQRNRNRDRLSLCIGAAVAILLSLVGAVTANSSEPARSKDIATWPEVKQAETALKNGDFPSASSAYQSALEATSEVGVPSVTVQELRNRESLCLLLGGQTSQGIASLKATCEFNSDLDSSETGTLLRHWSLASKLSPADLELYRRAVFAETTGDAVAASSGFGMMSASSDPRARGLGLAQEKINASATQRAIAAFVLTGLPTVNTGLLPGDDLAARLVLLEVGDQVLRKLRENTRMSRLDRLDRFLDLWDTIGTLLPEAEHEADFRYLRAKSAVQRQAVAAADRTTTNDEARLLAFTARDRMISAAKSPGASSLVRHGAGFHVAMLSLLSGDWGGTADAVERLQSAFPRSQSLPELYHRLGICYGNMGNPAESKKYLDRLVLDFPGSTQARTSAPLYERYHLAAVGLKPSGSRRRIFVLAGLNALLVVGVAGFLVRRHLTGRGRMASSDRLATI